MSVFLFYHVLENYTTSCILLLSAHGRIEERVKHETEFYLITNTAKMRVRPALRGQMTPIKIRIALIPVYSREPVTKVESSSCTRTMKGDQVKWKNSRSKWSALT